MVVLVVSPHPIKFSTCLSVLTTFGRRRRDPNRCHIPAPLGKITMQVEETHPNQPLTGSDSAAGTQSFPPLDGPAAAPSATSEQVPRPPVANTVSPTS